MTSPIRDHVYRGDGGACTYVPFGYGSLTCAQGRDKHARVMTDGEMKITDHIYQGVMGHPDDDECTHRADGTDETYCGRSRHQHADPGDGRPPKRFDGLTREVRGQALQRTLEAAVEGFFDRQITFPETQELHRLSARLVGTNPSLPPLADVYVDATGARWRREPDGPAFVAAQAAYARRDQHPNQVGPHEFQRQGWRFWLCTACYAPRELHPRTGYARARSLGDHTYYDASAPHFQEGW